MAIIRRSAEFNDLDTTIGTNEYSPGGGNNPSVNTTDGRQLQGGGCVTFQARNGSETVAPGAADGTSHSGRFSVLVGSLSWGLTTSLNVICRDTTSTNFVFSVPTSYFPSLSGFVPVWVRTDTQAEAVGLTPTAGSVPNNSGDNYIIDNITRQADASTINPVYGITGTSTIADLATAESNSTTGFNGCCVENNGIYFFYAGVGIGNSNSASTLADFTFSESGQSFVIVDQPAITSNQTEHLTWSINLNASNTSTFLMQNCNYSSSNTGTRNIPTKITFLGSGTSSSAKFLNCNLLDLDSLTLTSACEIEGGLTRAVDITQASAHIFNGTITTQSVAGVATIDDPTFGATTGIHDVAFIQGGAGHALDITSSTSLTNVTFSGYSADGTTGAAVVNSSSNDVTLTRAGTTSAITVTQTGVGGSINVVGQPRNFKLTGLKDATEVRIINSSNNTEIAGVESVSGGTGTGINNGGGTVTVTGSTDLNDFNYAYQFSASTNILYAVVSGSTYEIIYQESALQDSNKEIPIQQQIDRNALSVT